MKNLLTLLLFTGIIFITSNNGQQITEGFETGLPTGETTGNVTLGSGEWYVSKSYATTTKNSGTYGCYIKKSSTGFVITPNIATNGVGEVTFWAYCTADPATGNLTIAKSIDGGAFINVEAVTVPKTTWQQFSVTVNDVSDNIKIRFHVHNNNNVIIDDVVITPAVSGTPPTVTTASISNIDVTTATGGGNVTNEGSSSVTVRGVCWSTSETPTVADSKTENGSGTGAFVSSLTGLISNTTYYVRAYATNSAGTSYGDQVSFTTLSGTPDIALSSSNPAVAPGSMGRGLVKGVLYKITLAVTTASATLQQVDFSTTGTYAEDDITKFQLWYNTSNDFGAANQLGSDITTSLGVGSHSFASLTQEIAANATGYLWITTNVAETATLDNTISVAAVTTDDITFASGNKSGTAYAGGTQTFIAPSNTTDHFRSKQTGNWSDASTWESSSDGSSWIPATLTPTDEANTITTRNEHEVTVTTSVSVDQVTIQSGGQVTINSGQTFMITNGADDVDCQVNGTLKNSGTVTPTGTLAFGSGGVYEHAQDGGFIPISDWGNNSTCLVTGSVGSSPSNNDQAFHNFTWNCISQSGNRNLVWGVSGVTSINGSLTVTNSGSGEFRLTNSSIAHDINIVGNFIINSSNANFKISGSASNGLKNINIGGDVLITGGTFAISGNSAANFSWNVSGDVSFTNVNLTKSSSETVSKLVFNKNGNQNLTIGTGTTFSSGFPIEVGSGSVVNIGTGVFSGSGFFTLNSGATLISTHENGLNGNLTTSGTKALSTEANYTYNGSVSQVTGSLLPTTVNNLTIDNSANVTLSNNLQVNGTLLKVNGDLLDGGFTLTYGPSSSTGAVQALNAPSSVNVGDLGAVISSGANLGSTTVTRGLYALAGNSNQGIKRWYKITPTNNTGLSATLVFPYNEGDELNGITEGNLRLFKSTDDGATWTMVTTVGDITVTHDPDNNTFTVTGLDGFSLWTLGDNSNPLPVELTSFNAKASGKNVILNWATATEIDNYGFEIERTHHNPPFEKAGTQGGWEKLGFVQGSGNSNSVKEYSFTDKSSKKNGTFVYRLKQIDNNGTFQYSNEVEVEVNIPLSYAVSQNYPNPFNPSTRIEYQIPVAGKVSIKLYDVLGNLVTSLVDETKEAGSYIFDFDARNLSNGVYFYQIRAGEFIQTKKMTLIK